MRLRTFIFTLLVLVVSVLAFAPVGAQDVNLLQDPGFEGPYANRGRPNLNTPAAWPIWLQQGPTGQEWENRGDHVFAFPHNAAPQVLSFPASLNLNGGFVQFAAAVFQQVTVPNNANLIGSVGVWIQSCNTRDSGGNFIPGSCGSTSFSEAYVRVGVDPTGGIDPTAPWIIWGPSISPLDHWETATVNATAQGTQVTFFIYTNSRWPTDFNNRYYDNASLVVGGPGGTASVVAPTPGAPVEAGATPVPTRPTAFVAIPQEPQADGSIVHVVQPGDTISGISIAYGVTQAEILELNDLTRETARRLQVGQRLLIQEAS
jgi:LysM repeat protein